MSKDGKKIFIAVKDAGELGEIQDGLKPGGYEVLASTDGNKIVEQAISAPPLMIIVDKELPTVSGARIFNMLINNTATSNVPFIFLSDDDDEVKGFRSGMDIYLRRPYIWDELHARIRQAEALASSRSDEDDKVIEGNLAQMSLPDLLQVLELNSKEGVLKVTSEGMEGIIYISGGMIFNAAIGDIEKEKALYRILSWSKGHFSFRPQTIKTQQVITNSSGNLMMEGMRQMDEYEKDKDKLPSRTSVVKAKIDLATLPKNLKPVIFEIICHIENYSMVGDIVDHCSFPDLDVYQNMSSLIKKGVIEVVEGAAAEGEKFTGLIAPVKALKIKEKLISRWSDMLTVNFGKVYFAANSAESMGSFLDASKGLPDVKVNADAVTDCKGSPPLGEVGLVKLYGDLDVILFSIPALATMNPLVKSFSSHLMGLFIIIGDESEAMMTELAELSKAITFKRRVPVILINTGDEGAAAAFEEACKAVETEAPNHKFTLGAEGADGLTIYKTFFDYLAREDYTFPGAYAI